MSDTKLAAAFNALKENGVDPLKDFGEWIDACNHAFQANYATDNDIDLVASAAKHAWQNLVKNDLGIMLETLQTPENSPAYNREQIFSALNHVYGQPDFKIEVFAKLEGDISPTAGPRWQNTDIYVEDKNTIHFQYVSGQWTANPATGMVDADGNPGFVAKEGYTIPGANEGALVGRLVSNAGPTRPFLIGKSYKYLTGSAGYLELGINDDLMGEYGEGFEDNEGFIIVDITVDSPTV